MAASSSSAHSSSPHQKTGSVSSGTRPSILVNKEMVDLVGSEEQLEQQLQPPPSRTNRNSSSRHRSSTGYESIDGFGDKESLIPNSALLKPNCYNNKKKEDKRNRSSLIIGNSTEPLIASGGTNYRAFEEDVCSEDIQAQYESEGYNMIVSQSQASGDQSEGVIIDGRFSLSMSIIPGEEEEGFVAIDVLGNSDMSTTKALDMCTKYVLNPYHVFLKIIGWRSFKSPRAHDTPWYRKCCNVLYPTFIFLMLIFTSLSQIATCFSRTQSDAPILINGSHYILQCRKDLVTGTVIGDLLILIAYLWAFWVFRYTDNEHLSNLIQTVFLSCTSKLVHNSPKRLVMLLLLFLIFGVGWIVFSFIASVSRIFALKLDQDNTYIGWFVNESNELIRPSRYDSVHYTLVVVSIFGFFFFDLLYIAVTINYVTQCELLHFYVRNIKEKVKTKDFLLGNAVKELYHVSEYLRVLNGKLSYITSLIFFIFIQGVIMSYMSLLKVNQSEYLNIFVGLMNVIQWLAGTLILLIQSTRLTAECNGIRKLGLEIGARPFVYSDTPQLVLDSFVVYTNATNYKAKLAFVPMYPSLVCGFFFVFGLIMTIYQPFTEFDFATWL